MVIDILSFFLVFYGFYVAFSAALMDFMSTYLPEMLIYSGLGIGVLGWALLSLFSGRNYVGISVGWALLYFLLGRVGYRFRLWAAGDVWYLASTSALLAPAFPNYHELPKYLLVSCGGWALVIFVFMALKFGFWKRVLPPLFLSLLLFLLGHFPSAILLLFFGVLLGAKDVDRFGVVEKNVKELEEDDLLERDLDLGFTIIRAREPVSGYDAFLARKFGEGKTKVKMGYPLTPAFAMAYVLLLCDLVFNLP